MTTPPDSIQPTATCILSSGGARAEIRSDALVPGAFVLAIDGTDQSHVDLRDPGALFHDYVRRIGTVIDLLRMPGQPITAVHLGAGALTLPRYIQVTRPDSRQHVVELHPELVDFVTAHLPLPAGTQLTVHPGDAALEVPRLAGRRGVPADPSEGFADLVVSDLYRGIVTPRALRTAHFYADVARLLTRDGILAVNVADDAGLPVTRDVLEAVTRSLPHALVLGPASVVTAGSPGNTVLVASRSPALLDLVPRFAAAGPHPGAVLTAEEFAAHVSRHPIGTATTEPTEPAEPATAMPGQERNDPCPTPRRDP